MKRLFRIGFVLLGLMGISVSAPMFATAENLADLADNVPVYQLPKYPHGAFEFAYTGTGHRVIIDGHVKNYNAPNHFVVRAKDGYIMVDNYGDGKQSLSLIATPPNSPAAFLMGRLGDGFPYAIEALIKDHPRVKILMLQNIPGGLNIAQIVKGLHMIYDAGITTIVTDDVQIASAGSAVFMAGKYRFAMQNAKVGIHDFGEIAEGEENDATRALKAFYKKAGLRNDFYDFMRSKPNASMYWMSGEEMREYNIINTTAKEIERMLKVDMKPLEKPMPIEEYKFFS